MRPITVSQVTLLPDPDSPTTPSVSPGEMASETPSTAFTTPSSVGKWTLRSFTSSRGSATDLLEGPGRPLGRRDHVYLTLGSRNAYTTSTRRLATTMNIEAKIVTPIVAGKSS